MRSKGDSTLSPFCWFCLTPGTWLVSLVSWSDGWGSTRNRQYHSKVHFRTFGQTTRFLRGIDCILAVILNKRLYIWNHKKNIQIYIYCQTFGNSCECYGHQKYFMLIRRDTVGVASLMVPHERPVCIPSSVMITSTYEWKSLERAINNKQTNTYLCLL